MKSLLVAVISLFLVSKIQAMNVDEYLNQYKSKNRSYQALDLLSQSSLQKQNESKLEFSPLLSLGYLKNSDKSLPNQFANKRQVEQYDLSLAQKFSTGTQVKLEAKTLRFNNEGTSIPGTDKYSTGALGISLKQSLWKDFFGVSSRIRLHRGEMLRKINQLSVQLQNQAAILESEVLFWDYAFYQEDFKLKKANLERAQKLLKWTNLRLGNGISDKADFLNSKALVALRELQVTTAMSDLKNTEIRVRQNLELSDDEKTPTLQLDSNKERPYIKKLKQLNNIVKMEIYLASLEADISKTIADETTDNLKPDLNLFGSYYYTSFNKDYDKAVSEMTQSELPQSTIGVSLSWLLGGSIKSSTLEALEKESLSSALKASRKKTDSVQSWSEFVRQYNVLEQQAKILDQIVEIQKNRLQAENQRFSKGRSVTASVITAETEAAEAESNALKTRIGLRKYEASSLLYFSPTDLN